jgi:hypothetical protein
MTGRPCDVPTGAHDGRVRLYPCGWRCTSHAPQARTTANEPTTTVTPIRRPRTPREEPLRITGALRIDAGEGFATKDAGPGQFAWKTQPRARYECVTCGWKSEIVTGATAIRTFINHIRATHKAACTGAPIEGAQAA